MSDNGPEPMRNLKPAEKQLTAAEKFNIEHSSGYDAVNSSHDKISQVHDKAHPNMTEVLDKKQSTANPTQLMQDEQRRAQKKCKQYCCNCIIKFKHRKCGDLKIGKDKIRKNVHRLYKANTRCNLAKKFFRFSQRSDKGCQFTPDVKTDLTKIKPGCSKENVAEKESSHGRSDVLSICSYHGSTFIDQEPMVQDEDCCKPS